MIIGLTGSYCAGKGEMAAYLVKKGFSYFSLSDEIRLILKERNIPESREALMATGNELRSKNGAGYFAEVVAGKIRGNAVVDSIRNPAEVEVLRRQKGFFLVSVEAPIKLRYKRSVDRARSGDIKSYEEFAANEKKEMSSDPSKQQLHLVIAMADQKILNDSTLDELYRKIDILVNKYEKA
jgi:dephospho-CoA kinase